MTFWTIYYVVCGAISALPVLPHVIRWGKRKYYRYSLVVHADFLWTDLAQLHAQIRSRKMNFFYHLMNNALGHRHNYAWRKIHRDVDAWFRESRVSYWFDFFKADAYAAGRLHFRTEADRAYFVLCFYRFAVMEHD